MIQCLLQCIIFPLPIQVVYRASLITILEHRPMHKTEQMILQAVIDI